ncbi:hypothetical protein Ab1vBOLIVR5_gp53 [Agrobacterium phage OLIVR5]|uniref:Uncharacterized protein n=1 Tax=Agrobacterium phage OLIVR5 TaxID=2723773 RepID=A0A858MTH1_9CAUD|nr:hypothetical protein KNU99_gp053 [Agrobacterium phage OLIVR5]QIW87701.1 hypothetical protein Ab1vBOLIVR5_gp53 [Agrobacterium phage OLIVR5]QIW87963.1 hypothetical protein Ab1vBOLIVR6_gp56 [Agrobacterium phage OLIVR6]
MISSERFSWTRPRPFKTGLRWSFNSFGTFNRA